MNHESKARQIHRTTGCSCSSAVYRAFADVNTAGGTPPAPRSIAGKCGALLAAQRVLEDMGVQRTNELEHDFVAEMGYAKCTDLLSSGCNCNDCVGVAARLAEEYLAQEGVVA